MIYYQSLHHFLLFSFHLFITFFNFPSASLPLYFLYIFACHIFVSQPFICDSLLGLKIQVMSSAADRCVRIILTACSVGYPKVSKRFFSSIILLSIYLILSKWFHGQNSCCCCCCCCYGLSSVYYFNLSIRQYEFLVNVYYMSHFFPFTDFFSVFCLFLQVVSLLIENSSSKIPILRKNVLEYLCLVVALWKIEVLSRWE